METENKDWKPEVGGKAWVVGFDSVYEILITDVLWEESQNPWYKGTIWYHPLTGEYNAEIGTRKLFPTSEAALASIKIYDLEGKEVVIPRAEPNFLLQELESSGRILSLLEKEFFEFCKQCPENVAKFGLALMGGGAANGGKLYETELDSEIKYVAKSKKPISDFDAQKLHFYLNDERGVSGSCEPIDWKSDQREGGC